MSDNHSASWNRDTLLENFAAEVTSAAYAVSLRHGAGDQWLDLQLELWRAMKEMVKQCWQEPEAVDGVVRDGLGHGRDARLPLSGE